MYFTNNQGLTDSNFNFEDALLALQSGQPLSGQDGVLTPLIKQLTEAALAAELDTHLADKEGSHNRKNGTSRKTMKSVSGNFELSTPRDRSGSFEPQFIKKYQTHMSDEIERKILSMYALGMSYSDISGHIEDMYSIGVAASTISAVTDKLIPKLKQWQMRPLESHCPIVWLDAIHYKIKDAGGYVSKAVYTVLGLKLDGTKEILGLYLSDSEGARVRTH